MSPVPPPCQAFIGASGVGKRTGVLDGADLFPAPRGESLVHSTCIQHTLLSSYYCPRLWVKHCICTELYSPYHKTIGIPPAGQPVNKYLLRFLCTRRMQHAQETDQLAKTNLAYSVPNTVLGRCVTSFNPHDDSEVSSLVPIFWGDNQAQKG